MPKMAVAVDLEPALDPTDFARFRRYIYEAAGIDLGPTKRALIQSRLAKRLRALHLDSYGAYWELLKQAGAHEERQRAINALTTNETYFFREPDHFSWLQHYASELSECRREPIKVWSAACSTGEEPYTMAMVLAERLGMDVAWQVMATDINTQVTRFARRAIYPLESARKIPPHLRQRFCQRGLEEYACTVRVRPELTKRIEFFNVNLLTCANFPHDAFDVIFLRNILIYLDDSAKTSVLSLLCRKLRAGGYLVVGHSEAIQGKALPLQQEAISRYRLVDPMTQQRSSK